MDYQTLYKLVSNESFDSQRVEVVERHINSIKYISGDQICELVSNQSFDDGRKEMLSALKKFINNENVSQYNIYSLIKTCSFDDGCICIAKDLFDLDISDDTLVAIIGITSHDDGKINLFKLFLEKRNSRSIQFDQLTKIIQKLSHTSNALTICKIGLDRLDKFTDMSKMTTSEILMQCLENLAYDSERKDVFDLFNQKANVGYFLPYISLQRLSKMISDPIIFEHIAKSIGHDSAEISEQIKEKKSSEIVITGGSVTMRNMHIKGNCSIVSINGVTTITYD